MRNRSVIFLNVQLPLPPLPQRDPSEKAPVYEEPLSLGAKKDAFLGPPPQYQSVVDEDGVLQPPKVPSQYLSTEDLHELGLDTVSPPVPSPPNSPPLLVPPPPFAPPPPSVEVGTVLYRYGQYIINTAGCQLTYMACSINIATESLGGFKN